MMTDVNMQSPVISIILFLLSILPRSQEENIDFNNDDICRSNQSYTVDWHTSLKCYHSNKMIASYIEQLKTMYYKDGQVYSYSIGQSVNGHPILAFAIASQNASIHIPHRAEIRFIANIHGEETFGREILLRWSWDLLQNQNKMPEFKRLLSKSRIHFLPTLNPDGFSKVESAKNMANCKPPSYARENANGVNLNRDFPNKWQGTNTKMQPETKATINWTESINWALSTSLHGGAALVNYPYDGGVVGSNMLVYLSTNDELIGQAPDDTLLRNISRRFTQLSLAKQRLLNRCAPHFDNSITRGVAWYPVYGSLQDYEYGLRGIMATTIELTCCKHPPPGRLPRLYQEFKESFLQYALAAIDYAVTGFVTDVNGRPVPGTQLWLENRENDKDPVKFYASDIGDFYRVMLPSDSPVPYKLWAQHDQLGFAQQTFYITNENRIVRTMLIFDRALPDQITTGEYHHSNKASDHVRPILETIDTTKLSRRPSSTTTESTISVHYVTTSILTTYKEAETLPTLSTESPTRTNKMELERTSDSHRINAYHLTILCACSLLIY